MPPLDSTAFLNELDDRLWKAANRFRSNLNATMRSSGYFTKNEAFSVTHGSHRHAFSIYGQENTPTTWRQAAMNMAIRGTDFAAQRQSASLKHEVISQNIRVAKDHFDKQPTDTFLNNQHSDLRTDYVIANPPFNMQEWRNGRLEGDQLSSTVIDFR